MVRAGTRAKPHSTQFGFHVKENSTFQLISNDLQKLISYFSGAAVFTPFLSVIRLDLHLNDEQLFGIYSALTVKLTFPSISSLLKCHKLPEVSE